jgi:arsenate reductase (thioredoxin)
MKDPMAENKLNLLFVCIENSNRSQMAEAFARIEGGERVNALSSGSRPSGVVNPKAIASMAELGYDLAAHQSKPLDRIPDIEYDAVVTMGCGDACPFVKAKRRYDWQIPDPKHMGPDEFRGIRELIRSQVQGLLRELA